MDEVIFFASRAPVRSTRRRFPTPWSSRARVTRVSRWVFDEVRSPGGGHLQVLFALSLVQRAGDVGLARALGGGYDICGEDGIVLGGVLGVDETDGAAGFGGAAGSRREPPARSPASLALRSIWT